MNKNHEAIHESMDPAFNFMALSIVGEALKNADNPDEMGRFVTKELRQMTGARGVILLQNLHYIGKDGHKVVAVLPERFRNMAESEEMNHLSELTHNFHEPVLWDIGISNGEVKKMLGHLGFKQSIVAPLNVGDVRIGCLLLLDIPEDAHGVPQLLQTLKMLSTTIALVLHNAFLFEQQEAIIDERTRELVKANKMLCAEITERKHVEEKLKQQQYYLEKAQELGQIGTWELDLRLNRLVWTDENCRIFGVPIGTVVNYEIFLGTVHPDDREYVNREWKAALEGKPYDIEHRIIVDGETKWVREKADVDFDKDGKAVKAIGFTQDITERKQAEASLKESEERFRRAIFDAPFPIMIHAEDGQVLQISKVWTDITGYSHSDIPTISKWTEKAYGQRKYIEKKDIDRLYKTNEKVHEREYVLTTSTSEKRIWDFSSAPLGSLPDGRRLIISMAADVTDRKNTEKQLRQSQKMEAIGTLAGGIAHDFNNILGIIMGYTQLCLDDTEKESLLNQNIGEIYKASNRAKNLVQQILVFSRKQEQERKPINILTIVKEA